jgi:hypothetical protein
VGLDALVGRLLPTSNSKLGLDQKGCPVELAGCVRGKAIDGVPASGSERVCGKVQEAAQLRGHARIRGIHYV